MKAINIHQPWASVIAFGEKRFETRSWKTDYRGPLLIHASRTLSPIERSNCGTNPFQSALVSHVITSADQLPTGRIITLAVRKTFPFGGSAEG